MDTGETLESTKLSDSCYYDYFGSALEPTELKYSLKLDNGEVVFSNSIEIQIEKFKEKTIHIHFE